MHIFANALKWILRFLKTLFIQPFIWYSRLTVKRKILVGFGSFIAFCLLILLLPAFLFFTVASGMFGEMPSDKELQAVKNYQASEVYSVDSVLLGRYFVENRSDARYDEVAPSLFQAIIATEDARFYQHKGVDTKSLLRVLFKSVLLRQKTGGGSTISQQLAKNLFGRKKYGFLTMPINKIREGIIANQLERLYSKNEILMLYVNTVSFGEDTYGIKTAAQRFYSVTPAQLTPEQAAVLAGMLKSPSYYNPRRHPANALKRRNLVLEQMQKYEYLTIAQSNALQKKPLRLAYKRFNNSEGAAPYFRERLKAEIEQWLPQHPKPDGSLYNLYEDGLKIYTTIHSKLQTYAEDAATEHLKRIQPLLQRDLQAQAFFKQHNDLLLNGIKQTARYQALSDKGLSSKEIITELQKKDSLNVFTLSGEKVLYISPIDSVRMMLSMLQVGMLVVNPHNGNVLAWVGGSNYKQVQYDHVLAQRQAGSVFKPVVYAQALKMGVKPCDFISNQSVTYSQYDDWTPQNANEKNDGRYSMAGALANSVNTISVQLCMQAGIKNVIGLARSLGIQSALPSKPSIALGTADMSLWELTGAYTAFANNGVKPDLQFITSIVNEQGEQIYSKKPVYRTIFTAEQAHEMTNMLCNAVDKGTAHELRDRYGFTGSIAGKTGTTQDHKDGWFMGYTSGFLSGVWVGADNPAIHFSSMNQGKGSATAMPIWAGFYRRVMNDASLRYLASRPFPFPNELECEMYKDNTFIQKLFQKKNKTDNSSGLDEAKQERIRKRKEREARPDKVKKRRKRK